ncbi:major facilitator superfamily domain-containing protein [Polychytrium aggregatum]|uniref:major facilitator superfamily domain-containing protein n=1 Tax=Polychytrium aggregatum TaxID=110093 RepID=UPI0022FEF11C|nr:major facilitator superfamily domain-containing protein [Polychytrium aggregatum]KAI9199436.1 major facilitator superfamily domain-containing protein [Polychytrium aggregatum]
MADSSTTANYSAAGSQQHPDPALEPVPEAAAYPISPRLRWLVLFLTCFVLFGNFYAYDNPAALNLPLQIHLGHDYDRWQYELNLLYSVYALPNMFLPFIGGVLLDRFGKQRSLLWFSSILVLGQILFSIGVAQKSIRLMLVGRCMFGIGGETVGVVQSAITSTWFRDKELAFALGLNLGVARLGSVVNAIMSPRLEKWIGVEFAVWAGTATCILSFVVSMILSVGLTSPAAYQALSGHSASTGETISHFDTVSTTMAPCDTECGASSSIDADSHATIFEPCQSNPVLCEDELCTPKRHQSTAGLLASLAGLSPSFWTVSVLCVLLYSTVIPFNNIASDFLMSKWFPNDTETAGVVMSIPDSVSVLLIPPVGYFVDHYGRRITLLFVCSFILMASHLLLGLTMLNPVLPMLMMGISYCIYGVTVWPSIAMAATSHSRSGWQVEELPLLGIAFGIASSLLNTFLALVPLAVAQIRVSFGSFVGVELFFVTFAFVAALCCLVLEQLDRLEGGALQGAPALDDHDDHDDE